MAGTYKFANVLLAVSFFAMPAMMIYFWRKRRNDITHPWILRIFGFFLFLCGVNFVNNIAVLHTGPYRYYIVSYFVAGLFGAISVCTLPFVVVGILKLPSRAVVHALNQELGNVILAEQLKSNELDAKNRKLISRIKMLEDSLESNAWMHDKATAMQQLREMLLTIGPDPDKGT